MDSNDVSPNLLAKAKAIHERVFVLDTHVDINVKNFTDTVNFTLGRGAQNGRKGHGCLYRPIQDNR